MSKITINVTPTEAVKAKFIQTKTLIAAYILEARSHIGLRGYQADAVVDRLERIQKAFDADQNSFSDCVRVRGENSEQK